MERKKKKENGLLYTAICCLAVAVGVVGFANSKNKKNDNTKYEQIAPTEEIKTQVPDDINKEKTPKAEEKKVESVGKNTVKDEKITFARPVKGKVITDYSGDELIYNEGLRDWRTHSGVDLEAKQGEQVVAASNGVVGRVYDCNLGHCVTIDHENGYETVYANLSEDTTLKKGDEIAEGDVVGLVGDTALGDATDVPHLHFEIIYNGNNVNPCDWLE